MVQEYLTKKISMNKLPKIQFPQDNKEAIFLCLSSDSNYEPHLWVTISSIIDSTKSKSDYYIYILDGGIKNKESFYNLVSKDKRFNIEFIDMSNQYLSSFESRHVSKSAYYRLSIFKLFKDFKKVIYIDADSFVLSDIEELYNFNIGNKQIAGVKDSISYEIPWREKYIKHNNYSGKALNYYKDYLGFSKEKFKTYFSSGVLLFNLDQIDIKVKQKQLEELLLNDYYSHDQDILNLLFDEKETYILGREWNYFNSGPVLTEEDFLLEEEKNNYLNNKVKPKIVSYVLKPWYKENIDKPYVKEYWEILKQSPYYEEVKNDMEKNTKWYRFTKMSLKEKINYLTSKEAIKKYKSLLK
jgi:lipopolysaccharide biosynthesis glycosyltransferase